MTKDISEVVDCSHFGKQEKYCMISEQLINGKSGDNREEIMSCYRRIKNPDEQRFIQICLKTEEEEGGWLTLIP